MATRPGRYGTVAMIGDPCNKREQVLRLRGVFSDQARLERYVSDGWERIQVVLGLLTDLHRQGVRRVLELGANPYIMTLLIRPKFQRPKQGNPLSVSMITGFNLQAYWVQSVMA